jgi:hypothetical protein
MAPSGVDAVGAILVIWRQDAAFWGEPGGDRTHDRRIKSFRSVVPANTEWYRIRLFHWSFVQSLSQPVLSKTVPISLLREVVVK